MGGKHSKADEHEIDPLPSAPPLMAPLAQKADGI